MAACPGVLYNTSLASIDNKPSFLSKLIDIALNALRDTCGFSFTIHSFFIKVPTDLVSAANDTSTYF